MAVVEAAASLGPSNEGAGDAEGRGEVAVNGDNPEESATERLDAAAVSGSPPCSLLPLSQRVEAVLLCSDRPISDLKIAEVLGLIRSASGEGEGKSGDAQRREAIAAVHAAIHELNETYKHSGRIFRIEAVAGGRQILTLPALGQVVARMKASRSEGRLSPAALETLAIVAYRQPILRADIESIRGVACGEVLRTLMERRLVRIVGRSDEIGRPMLYGTTKEFLRAFGLARIDDLPTAQDGPAA